MDNSGGGEATAAQPGADGFTASFWSLYPRRVDEQRAIGERGRAAHEALDAAIAADPFDEGLVRAKASDLAIVEDEARHAAGEDHLEQVGQRREVGEGLQLPGFRIAAIVKQHLGQLHPEL